MQFLDTENGIIGILASIIVILGNVAGYLLKRLMFNSTPLEQYHKIEAKLDEKDKILLEMLNAQPLRLDILQKMAGTLEQTKQNTDKIIERVSK